MRIRHIVVTCFLSLSALAGYAQSTDTLRKQLDSLHREDQKTKPELDVDKEDYTSQTNITPKAYFVLLGTDAVQEVTGPFHTSGRTWIRVGGFALMEGALLFLDKPLQRETNDFMNRNPNLRNVSEYVTNFGATYQGYVLLGFAAYGVIFKSNKVKTTTLLATQSYIISAAMSTLVKFCVGRARPSSFTEGNPDNLFFQPFNKDGLGSSFPSGHTIAAFSAATVFAQEYQDQTLIPVVAYSAAMLVGLSRITQNRHWATDVVAGAALGYVTGKQVVRNYHRYARLRNGQKKTSWDFNINIYDGVVMPGLVCRF